jgi:branched-chain amino acid transport system substrate-binding protein
MPADLRLVLPVLAAALALTAAGCGGGHGGAIRIGVLSDCVGTFGAYNDLTLAAAELPLLQRGARLAGRQPSAGIKGAEVAGRRVELLTGCTEISLYTKLIDEVRRLVEKDGADVIIGPIGFTDGLVLRDYARRHPDIAFLLTYSGAQEATLHDPAQNVFRFEPDGAQWVAGLGSYAYHDLGWRTVATVAENSTFAWPEVAGFVAEFCALGGRVLDRLWTPPYAPPGFPPELAAYAAKVPKTADGVALFPNFYQDTVGFARALRKRRPDLAHSLIIGPLGFNVPTTLGGSGRLLVGVVTGLNQPFESQTPAFRAYARSFRRFFPDLAPQPSAPTDHTIVIPYRDAMEATLEALERGHGELSHGERAFMDALSAVVLDSPNGRIHLDADRQAIAPAYLSRVGFDANGRPVLRTLRVVPEVEQTFAGLFSGSTPPPSSVAPGCRRAPPPPWAR